MTWDQIVAWFIMPAFVALTVGGGGLWFATLAARKFDMPVKNADRIHQYRSLYEFDAARKAMLAAYANWLYIAAVQDAAAEIESTTKAMRQLLDLRREEHV